jgi:CBS domain containing-hemolysin-like protein
MTLLLLILLTLLLSAYFSGLEIAYISANKLKIEVDKNQGRYRARILALLIRKPSRFLGALMLGSQLSLVLFGIALALLLKDYLRAVLPAPLQSELIIISLLILIASLIILITSEMIPRALFRINPNRILSILALPTIVVYWVFYPIILLFTGLSTFLLKTLFRVQIIGEGYGFGVTDLDEYIREFSLEEEDGQEVSQEMQMFQNAIDFRTVKIRECMIPRTEIAALEEKDSLEKLREKLVSTGFSRIMVYRQSIDNIVGYAHAFDLFKQPENIEEILKTPPFFPETMPAREALTQLIKAHRSLAVVVDEFGGTSGLVTMEDLMEEILGDISDEYDVEELIEKELAEGEYIFSGRLEIDYLNETYELDIPESEEYETLAGYILKQSNHIPVAGEEILADGLHITITQATDTRIEQVHLRSNPA